ncbi:recQ-mediated genome instability protein 1 [Esox lucius]|uniref:RecQ-mediated genome instability protein 1 n=1 Tax=Esox lucius TaxID=8010 RepID=A0A3P8ZD89_ESOLU|nr:recQ-mediated genome instability protein 1 [Esox lucius]XP_010875086.1 recQ-mediated genome instability protein 1 [Esox lucius]XP_010875087.1 recQ-mediated genome instability protein 1 [Esox lucius]XP_010875088.1 recQ-mediated genome instability protein 1 [Esox lucius]
MNPQGVVRAAQAWLQSSMQVQVPFAWLEACVEWLQQEGGGASLPQHQLNQQVLDQWLLTDLRDLAHPVLPARLSQAHKSELIGSFCVQLDFVLDVSQPAYGQLQRWRGTDCINETVSAVTQASQRPWEAKPTRMLLLQVTDGVQSLEAMEYQPIPALSTTLRPGVKLLLQGQMTCRLGVLLLKPGNVKVLGGEVEELVERHCQGKVLCRALGLPEEEPQGLAERPEEQPVVPLPQPGDWDASNQEPDDLELLASLEAQEGEAGWRTEPSLESGYGTHSEASSASYGNAPLPSRHLESRVVSSLGTHLHHGTIDSDMLDIPDEDFDDIPLDELDSVIIRESPIRQTNRAGSERDNLRQACEDPISLSSEVPNESHFDSLDERDDPLLDEDMDIFSPPEPEGQRQELRLDRNRVRQQGNGQASAQSVTTVTLKSQPFTYLCVLKQGPSPTGLPECVSEVRVKAFIVTLLGNLRSRAGEWQVSATISDGTGYMDVDLSDQVLTVLLGFSAAEKQKLDPARKAAGMKACQQGLVDMCCVMTLRLDPADGKALVIKADAVTEEDCLALEARVKSRGGR